jgi:hypothetical protein
MGNTIPHTQKLDLRAAFNADGWDVEPIEPAPSAWWLNELWRLRSRWRPVGATLFVSFCADPDAEGDPPAKVWSVGIGAMPATYFYDRELFEFGLSPGWPRQLPDIVLAAASLRDAATTSAP